jgi:predicted small secreted protein
MRRVLPTITLVVALPILLAACQTTGSGGTEVCSHWRSISWSKVDSLQTIDEVKGNNARRKAWCHG